MPTSPDSVNPNRSGTAPPAQPPGLIRRDRILGQLSSAHRAALVVVLVAPAGYGKTTVLTQWAAQDPPSFAWVAIDEQDNDPVELVRHIVSCLERIEPTHDPVLASLRSRRAPPQAVLVPGLLAWLGRHASDRVLVLDDLQRLHNPVSLDVVGTIVSQLPPGWRLAIASRTRPELHVTPLRRQGRYLELGPQQLTFSLPEVRTLLEVAGIANVTEQRLRALVRRTEAWPAGLHLTALSMLGGPDRAAVTRVSGDDGRLAGYFREEVLSPEGDTEIARFLLRTSVLARMSADLCDAV